MDGLAWLGVKKAVAELGDSLKGLLDDTTGGDGDRRRSHDVASEVRRPAASQDQRGSSQGRPRRRRLQVRPRRDRSRDCGAKLGQKQQRVEEKKDTARELRVL